jgi:hypothetical protein
MTLFRLLMLPANMVCDRLGLVSEHDRGIMRMLINMLLWTTIGATAFFAAWMLLVRPSVQG